MERPVRLPPVVWSALEHAARGDDVTVGQIIRLAVDRELQRRTRAKKADKPDERLIAPLRALLAEDLAFARDWGDLTLRLQRKGYRLEESGPGLVLAAHPGGARICKASDLGYSHARLARRLGTAFPGHAHGALIARAEGLSPFR